MVRPRIFTAATLFMRIIVLCAVSDPEFLGLKEILFGGEEVAVHGFEIVMKYISKSGH